MATHQQPSPTAGLPSHHGPPGHPQPNGHAPFQAQAKGSITSVLTTANEQTWLALGTPVSPRPPGLPLTDVQVICLR